MVDHFRRDVRDQVLWHPVHGAGQRVEVGLGVTVGAAAHGQRPLGKRREGRVQGIERVLELLPRIGHSHMLGAGRRQPGCSGTTGTDQKGPPGLVKPGSRGPIDLIEPHEHRGGELAERSRNTLQRCHDAERRLRAAVDRALRIRTVTQIILLCTGRNDAAGCLS